MKLVGLLLVMRFQIVALASLQSMLALHDVTSSAPSVHSNRHEPASTNMTACMHTENSTAAAAIYRPFAFPPKAGLLVERPCPSYANILGPAPYFFPGRTSCHRAVPRFTPAQNNSQSTPHLLHQSRTKSTSASKAETLTFTTMLAVAPTRTWHRRAPSSA